MIVHVIFFKLLDRSQENVLKTKDVLMNMTGKIPQLKYLEVGVDILHFDRSYDLVMISKFDSLEDLKTYQLHPLHVEVLNYLNTVKDSILSVDYEV